MPRNTTNTMSPEPEVEGKIPELAADTPLPVVMLDEADPVLVPSASASDQHPEEHMGAVVNKADAEYTAYDPAAVDNVGDHVGDILSVVKTCPTVEGKAEALVHLIANKVSELFEGDSSRLPSFADRLRARCEEIKEEFGSGSSGDVNRADDDDAPVDLEKKFEGRDPGTIGMNTGPSGTGPRPYTAPEQVGMPEPKPLNETAEYIAAKTGAPMSEANSKTAPGANL